MSDDMATMPVRDLIEGLREKAKSAADTGGILNSLVFNVFANRLEQEANWSESLQRFLDLNVSTWRNEIKDDQYSHNRLRHMILHRSLDELFACYIGEHPDQTQFLKMEFGDFLEWSANMTLETTCDHKEDKG